MTKNALYRRRYSARFKERFGISPNSLYRAQYPEKVREQVYAYRRRKRGGRLPEIGNSPSGRYLKMILKRGDYEPLPNVSRMKVFVTNDERKAVNRERMRLDRMRHPGKYRDIDKQRRRDPRYPLWRSLVIKNRRGRKLSGGHGSLRRGHLLHQYESQCGLCFWCAVPLLNRYTVDHYIPLSRGGEHTSQNCVLACAKCNSRKSNILPDEWRARLYSKAS